MTVAGKLADTAENSGVRGDDEGYRNCMIELARQGRRVAFQFMAHAPGGHADPKGGPGGNRVFFAVESETVARESGQR